MQGVVEQAVAQAVYAAYRLASYVLLNGVDDPALLAIVFC